MEWAPLSLRLAIGMGYVHHGWHHVFFRGQRAANEWVLGGIGLPSPHTAGFIISALSFACGIALILGAYVRVATLPPLIMTWCGLVTVSIGNGFDFMHVVRVDAAGPQLGFPGYEVPVIYIAALVSLAASGAGRFSIDALRSRRRAGRSVREPADKT